MRYYSDMTKKFYNSAAECEAAETEMTEKEAARKNEEESAIVALKAKQGVVEELREQYVSLGKQYNGEYAEFNKMLAAFSKKYGYVPKGFNAIDVFFSML